MMTQDELTETDIMALDHNIIANMDEWEVFDYAFALVDIWVNKACYSMEFAHLVPYMLQAVDNCMGERSELEPDSWVLVNDGLRELWARILRSYEHFHLDDSYEDVSLSHGTLITNDILESLFSTVLDDTPRRAELSIDWNILLNMYSDDETKREEALSLFLNETIFEYLNAVAPKGFSFGAHEGDGSNFGFWAVDKEEQELKETALITGLIQDSEEAIKKAFGAYERGEYCVASSELAIAEDNIRRLLDRMPFHRPDDKGDKRV